MVVLTEEMVLAKTRAEDLSAVKNLNLWGSDLTDVSILQVSPSPFGQMSRILLTWIFEIVEITKCGGVITLSEQNSNSSRFSKLFAFD